MNRDLIPKYTLRGESYIDFHGFTARSDKGMCVRISLYLQCYPIEISIDMLGYPSSSVIQKLYEIHKQGEFINAL